MAIATVTVGTGDNREFAQLEFNGLTFRKSDLPRIYQTRDRIVHIPHTWFWKLFGALAPARQPIAYGNGQTMFYWSEALGPVQVYTVEPRELTLQIIQTVFEASWTGLVYANTSRAALQELAALGLIDESAVPPQKLRGWIKRVNDTRLIIDVHVEDRHLVGVGQIYAHRSGWGRSMPLDITDAFRFVDVFGSAVTFVMGSPFNGNLRAVDVEYDMTAAAEAGPCVGCELHCSRYAL